MAQFAMVNLPIWPMGDVNQKIHGILGFPRRENQWMVNGVNGVNS